MLLYIAKVVRSSGVLEAGQLLPVAEVSMVAMTPGPLYHLEPKVLRLRKVLEA